MGGGGVGAQVDTADIDVDDVRHVETRRKQMEALTADMRTLEA